MTIDFSCSGCGKTISTPDGSLGKKARCPQCSQIMRVPETATSPITATRNVYLPSAKQSYNPYVSPSGSEFQGLARGATSPRSGLGFSEVLSDTWSVYSQNLGACVALGLLVFGLSMTVIVVILVVGLPLSAAVRTVQANEDVASLIMMFVGLLLMVPLLLIISWLQGGLIRFMLRMTRGETFEFGDAFSGGPFMLRLFGVNLMLMIVNNAINFICALPAMLSGEEALQLLGALMSGSINGIIALFILLSHYFIVDQDMGVFESVGASFDAMNGNALIVFGIYIVAGLISMLAILLTCGLGLLFVMPYYLVLGAVIYDSATGNAAPKPMTWG